MIKAKTSFLSDDSLINTQIQANSEFIFFIFLVFFLFCFVLFCFVFLVCFPLSVFLIIFFIIIFYMFYAVIMLFSLFFSKVYLSE